VSKKKTPYQLTLDYWSLLMVDHGILRLLYRNCFRLPGGLFRSNQPDPLFLRRMVEKHKIKTVVCLRGENDQHGWFRLERETCDHLNVKLITPTVYSRGLLTAREMEELVSIARSVELPALVHCKSGADRAGFFCSVYRYARLGEPIELTTKELSIRYGHFRGAKTGVLDFMLEQFLVRRVPQQSFLSWLRGGYDREALQHRFKPWAISAWIVDRFLRRE
jgi:protein tyrosine phosphatase (PTP) superfamily phosphohydrolase (DUF442 family)